MRFYGAPELVRTPEGVMVVAAPDIIAMSLAALVASSPSVHVHGRSAIVFGLAGQGCGRVAYWVTAWDPNAQALVLVRAPLPEGCDECRGGS